MLWTALRLEQLPAEIDWEVLHHATLELAVRGFSRIPRFLLQWVDAGKLNSPHPLGLEYPAKDECALGELRFIGLGRVLEFQRPQRGWVRCRVNVELEVLKVALHHHAENDVVDLRCVLILLRKEILPCLRR